MFYITLFCFVAAILSFMYFFMLLIKKYILYDKMESVNLKLIISLSFTLLFWLSAYSLNAVYERIQNPYINKTNGIEEYAGTFGDLIGGTLNPILALFGIVAAGLAFYAQYEANKQVQEQFKIQQFESQFFEMLRLHKENISEMKITGYEVLIETSKERDTNGTLRSLTETYTNSIRVTEGRKVFVTMNTELIACFELLQYFNNLWGCNISQHFLLDLAYKFFFFGSKSEIVASENISPQVINIFRHELNKIRKFHKNSTGIKNTFTGLNNIEIKLHIKYLPFSGHENRLGHYYRHLYSTVKYVVNKEKQGLIDYNQARGYLKILRSQMSNDEQLLLYYNYIIGFGKDWENDGFLTKYRMLHNLPINSVKYVTNPRIHFQQFIQSIKEDESALFEWGDTSKHKISID